MLTSNFPCLQPWRENAPRSASVHHKIRTADKRTERVITRAITTFTATSVAAPFTGSRGESEVAWRISRHRVIVIAMRHEAWNTPADVYAPLVFIVADGNKNNARVCAYTAGVSAACVTSAPQSIRFAWWCMKRVRRMSRENIHLGVDATNVAHVNPFVNASWNLDCLSNLTIHSAWFNVWCLDSCFVKNRDVKYMKKLFTIFEFILLMEYGVINNCHSRVKIHNLNNWFYCNIIILSLICLIRKKL